MDSLIGGIDYKERFINPLRIQNTKVNSNFFGVLNFSMGSTPACSKLCGLVNCTNAPIHNLFIAEYLSCGCMKSIFEILPSTYYAEDCSFSCEVSHEGVSFAIKNESDQKYIGVGVYHFDKSRPKAGFPIALQILFNSKAQFQKAYKKTTIVYSLQESALIPFQLFKSNTCPRAVDLIFGDNELPSEYLTDIVTESGYYNCFRIRKETLEVINAQFPNARQWHQYSGLLGSYSSKDTKMFVIFYSYKMVVSVFSEGKCLLINTYSFQNAQDVAYYLLVVKKMLDLNNIPLEVAGFIEQKSSLYQELYKYFVDISFQPFPSQCDFSDEIRQFPEHYFSHLFRMDACG